MPWKVTPAMHELRLALVHLVRQLGTPVAEAARRFGVSRRTAHKWLARHDADPAAPLADRPRRPRRSPARTPDAVERACLDVRDRYNWGPRKIHHFLKQQQQQQQQQQVPAVRTVADILRRHGRVRPPGPPPLPEPQRFEHARPNDLWQLDHKGAVEVDRRRVWPLCVVDDHSRYCLAFEPCPDLTMATAWAILWRLFGDVGLPDRVLADNAFGKMGTPRPAGISWFDARLVRLGVRPTHGRPYHPQTQGKVERLNGTAARELVGFNARRDRVEHFAADCRRWRDTYNVLRPHEAGGDRPPVTRWVPSPRPRPAALPAVAYDAGAAVRRVDGRGAISFRGCRILCGQGIAGEPVRVEERDRELAVFYGWKEIRRLSTDQLRRDTIL
jgi:transposase InsO family protein